MASGDCGTHGWWGADGRHSCTMCEIERLEAQAETLAGALRKCAGVLSGANLNKSALIDALEAARSVLASYQGRQMPREGR